MKKYTVTIELSPLTNFNRIALILGMSRDAVQRKMLQRFGKDAFWIIGRNWSVPGSLAETFIDEQQQKSL
jgi:hypothetical protein